MEEAERSLMRSVCVTFGLAVTSSPEPAGADFSKHYWVICIGISDSVHLLASMCAACIQSPGKEAE